MGRDVKALKRTLTFLVPTIGKVEHRSLWRTLYDTTTQALWQTAQPLRQRTDGILEG